MLNDMMSHFELFQPVDVDNAFDLLDRYRSGVLDHRRGARQPRLVQGSGENSLRP